jgi:hypothetical protein
MAVCPVSDCGKVTDGGRCEAHVKAENKRRNTHPRREVYDHPDWPDTRGIVFLRDAFNCRQCNRSVGPGSEAGTPVCAHWPKAIGELRALGLNPFDPAHCETQCLECSGTLDGARGSTVQGGVGGMADHEHHTPRQPTARIVHNSISGT